MKKLLILCAFSTAALSALSYAAEPGKPCDTPQLGFKQPMMDFCLMQKLNVSDEATIKALAADRKDMKVNEIMTVPTSRDAVTFRYKFPERVVKPGEGICFGVPIDLQGRAIENVILAHRQTKEMEADKRARGVYKFRQDKGKDWDDEAPFTSLQFHQKGATGTDAWRCWQDPFGSSGPEGGKFPEFEENGSYELESMYEWQHNGHKKCLGGSSVSHEFLNTDGICAKNSGKSEVRWGEVTVSVALPKADSFIEKVFADGMKFGEGKIPHEYKKGQGMNAQYPGSLGLGYKPSEWGEPTLPAGWIHKGNTLRIPLPKGKTVLGYQIIVGDSHNDGKVVPDEGTGTRGWAKLNAAVVSSNGARNKIMDKINVPPEGVLFGAPQDICRKTEDGDYLEIQANNDNAYVSGVRIWIKD